MIKPEKPRRSRSRLRPEKDNLQLLMALVLSVTALFGPVPVSAAETPYSEAFKAYDEKRYDEAFGLLLPLAEQGEGQAQMAISLLYERGLGVTRDIDKAMYWYERAALRGNPMIQNELGLKYFNGDGIARDYDKAATWWLKAAARGHVEAQYSLALMYVNGSGFTKNMAMATKWLDKAALRGHGPAHYTLGVMSATGNGAPQDYNRAFEHFSKAAEQDIIEAQFNLGVCYEKGRGTAVDLEQANAWYKKAAARGFAKAVAKLGPESIATPASVETPVASPEADDTGNTTLRSKPWLLQQGADKFALQLVVVSSLESVTRFFDTYQTALPKAYYTIQKDNKVLYRIVCGVFESRAAARTASEDISEQLGELDPVIVSYASIQAALKD